MVESLNSSNFEYSVSDGLSLVDFWAPWCGPCQMQGPILEELASEMTGVNIYKVNIDDEPKLAEQFSVMSIPTLMIFKDGEIKSVEVGVHTKEQLKDLLSQHID